MGPMTPPRLDKCACCKLFGCAQGQAVVRLWAGTTCLSTLQVCQDAVPDPAGVADILLHLLPQVQDPTAGHLHLPLC